MDKTIDLGLAVSEDTSPAFETFLDPERVLRLHPHWHVEQVDYKGSVITASLKDHATDKQFEFEFEMDFPGRCELLITSTTGPASRIHFFPRDQRMHVGYLPQGQSLSAEQKQDLTLWLQSIRQYLRLYLSTSLYTRFFRLLMNRAILKMNPSQRKICMMLYRFTLLEIVVILIIVIGYFTFGR